MLYREKNCISWSIKTGPLWVAFSIIWASLIQTRRQVIDTNQQPQIEFNVISIGPQEVTKYTCKMRERIFQTVYRYQLHYFIDIIIELICALSTTTTIYNHILCIYSTQSLLSREPNLYQNSLSNCDYNLFHPVLQISR